MGGFTHHLENSVLSISISQDRWVPFQIEGRSPAKRRFYQEEKALWESEDQEMVFIEFCFHPFWRFLGHTSLRIGNTLFEKKYEGGWKTHRGGREGPRAFLFNNPFFKRQINKWKQKMPPFSLGISWAVPACQARALHDTLMRWSHSKAKEHSYHIFKRNCTQSIIKALRKCEIDLLPKSWRWNWSSVLTFKELLQHPHGQDCHFYLYPLPGSQENLKQYQASFPRYFLDSHGPGKEFGRLLRTFDWNILINFTRKKLFRLRDFGNLAKGM